MATTTLALLMLGVGGAILLPTVTTYLLLAYRLEEGLQHLEERIPDETPAGPEAREGSMRRPPSGTLSGGEGEPPAPVAPAETAGDAVGLDLGELPEEPPGPAGVPVVDQERPGRVDREEDAPRA